MIDAYVAGINAWIAHTQTLTRRDDLDGDYKLAAVSDPTDVDARPTSSPSPA